MAKSQGEPHYRVPRELVDSLAFRSLPGASKLLWHDLMMAYRGRNNGNVSATMHDLKHYGWSAAATLAKALAYLIAHGFLAETRKGGGNACQLRQCCLYRFTHLPADANEKLGIKGGNPSFDYRQFDPTRLPEKINLTALKGLAGKNSCFKKRSVTLQKLKRDASEIEVLESSTLQKLKHEKVEKTAKTRASQGFLAIS